MYEDKTFYKVVKPIVGFLFKIVFRPKIVGVENIPKSGRVLLAGNHTSYLDPALLVTASPRQIHFLAKKELWSGITHFIVVGMGAVPVDRKIHDKDALHSAYKYLENEKCVGIFPEGTINRTDDVIMPFKIGAVKASNKTHAKLVPFIITGDYKIFRRSIKVEFLEPRDISDDLDKENKEFMDIVSKKLIEGGKLHGKKRKKRKNGNV